MDIKQRALELVELQKKEQTEMEIETPDTTNNVEKVTEEKPLNIADSLKDTLNNEYQKSIKEQAVNTEITQATKQVVERKAKAELTKDMLIVMNDEQQNALAQYYLECQKKQLEYRRKKEKKVIIEETEAEIQKRKFEALWLRYGYMYKNKENFIPSKTYNQTKEISNWWNGTSDNFKKIVKGTIKVLIWGAIAYLFIKYGLKVLALLPKDISL